jgi:hypothetical protein
VLGGFNSGDQDRSDDSADLGRGDRVRRPLIQLRALAPQ